MASLEDRLSRLYGKVVDPEALLHADALLDSIAALVQDCDLPSLKRNKNVQNFLDRYVEPVKAISESRLCKDDFQCIKVIGRGAFGEVRLVRHNSTKQVYALKMLSKLQMIERSDSAFFWEERDIMAKADSDWIVKLFFAFQDPMYLYMVMEYMPGGDLVNLMAEYDISEGWARFFTAEVCLALNVIHGMGFVHRDVKPDNMLLDRSGHLKLADFGTSVKVDKDGKVRADAAVGTPDYISPEVLQSQNGNGCYGKECDFWSVGIFLYEMLYAETPFANESTLQLYRNISNYKTSLTFADDIDVSEKAKKMIRRFLSDEKTRLGRNSPADIQAEPFMKHSEDWNWDNIRQSVAPVVPELCGDVDTRHFDVMDEEDGPKKTLQTPRNFSGDQLPFIGFTFCNKDHMCLSIQSPAKDAAPQAKTTSSGADSAELKRLQQLCREQEAKIKTLDERKGQLTSEVASKETACQQFEAQSLDQKREIGSLRLQVQSLQDVKSNLSEETKLREETESRLEDLKKKLASSTRSSTSESKVDSLEKELSSLTRRLQEEKHKNMWMSAAKMTSMREKHGLEETIEELTQKVANLERQHQVHTEELQAEVEIAAMESEAKRDVMDSLSKVEDEKNWLEEQLSMNSLRIDEGVSQRQSLEEQVTTLRREKNAAEAEARRNVQRCEQLEKLMDSQSAEKATKSSANQDQIDALQLKLQAEGLARKTAESRADDAEKELMDSVRAMEVARERLDATSKSTLDMRKRVDELMKQVEVEAHRRARLQEESKRLESDKQSWKLKERQMQQSLKDLQREKVQLTESVSKLQRTTVPMSEHQMTAENLTVQTNLVASLRDDFSTLEAVANKRRDELEEAHNELSSAQVELNTVKDKYKKLKESFTRSREDWNDRLGDLEQEKMMLELQINEMQVRSRTAAASQRNQQMQIDEEMQTLESKLEQLSLENQQLTYDNEDIVARLADLEEQSESRLEEESGLQVEYTELERKYNAEVVLKKEVIRKLEQLLQQRTLSTATTKGGGKAISGELHRKEHEIRKLRGDLEKERSNAAQLRRRFHQELTEIQVQVTEEQQQRRTLQKDLIEREDQIKELMRLSTEERPTNGVARAGHGGAASPGLPLVTSHRGSQETLPTTVTSAKTTKMSEKTDQLVNHDMQVPRNVKNIRKNGWKPQIVAVNFANQCINFFDDEDMRQQDIMALSIMFKHLLRVRPVTQADQLVSRLPAKERERIFQITYSGHDESLSSSCSSVSTFEEPDQVTEYNGHHFVSAPLRAHAICDACAKEMPHSKVFSSTAYECSKCQFKCHKQHVDKDEGGIALCVGDENSKYILVLASDKSVASFWVFRLGQFAASTQGNSIPMQLARAETMESSHKMPKFTRHNSSVKSRDRPVSRSSSDRKEACESPYRPRSGTLPHK